VTESRDPVARYLAKADAAGVQVTIDQSDIDGVIVVLIDTPGLADDAEGPIIRIYLNDQPLVENPPLPE
jgi:hypothetical protein